MTVSKRSKTWITTLALAAAFFASAGLARLLTPTLVNEKTAPKLESVIPLQFGDWQNISNSTIQVDVNVSPNQTTRDQPYDDLLSRTYIRQDGTRVMLSVAYGSQQRQEVKIHRPELCYPAQGLPVQSLTPIAYPIKSIGGKTITGNRMIASAGPGGVELVSYWIRIGSTYSDSPWVTRMTIIREGLSGHMTDGILVRASQRVPVGTDYDSAFRTQEKFLADLVAFTSKDGLPLIAR